MHLVQSLFVAVSRLDREVLLPLGLCVALLMYSPVSYGRNHDSARGQNKQNQTSNQRQVEEEQPAVPVIEYIRIKMGKSIFLDPPEEDEPEVYLRVRDTSGNDFNLQTHVSKLLVGNGFRPTRNAKKASYVLQANLLFAEEVSEAQLQQINESDYQQDIGDILAKTVAGVALGGAVDILAGDHQRLGAGAVVGGLVGIMMAHQEKVKKEKELEEKKKTKYFSAVVDIEVRQRAGEGEVIRRGIAGITQNSSSEVAPQSSLSGTERFEEGESSGTLEVEEYKIKSKWIRYRVRIIASAKGKHVTLNEVKGPLLKKLSNAVGGMF